MMARSLLSEPPRPSGPLVSPVVAADLAGIPLAEVYALVRAGSVRSERIKRELFVDLDDVVAMARPTSGEGAA